MAPLNITCGTFWRAFAPLFGAGVVGVAAVAPLVARQLAGLPGVAEESLPVLIGAALAQTTLLVAGAVAIGITLAPHLGLRSHLADAGRSGTPLLAMLRSELPVALGTGVIGAALMLAGDAAFRPLLGQSAAALAQAMPHNTLMMTVAGTLYGGIVEELLMRWGVMTLLAWIGWRVTSRLGKGESAAPPQAVMWAAITLAAVLFGAGHLPATAMIVPLTPVLIVRALVLNGIGGMLFGWLYQRHSLEAGMIAHATFHVVVTIVAVVAPTAV